MSSLLELVPQTSKVKVGDKEIDVCGVTAEGLAKLFVRFPAIGKAMSGVGSFDTGDLVKVAPDAVAAFIAAGSGFPGNEKAEAVAAKLPLQAQFDLLSEIVRLTFPSGVRPFVERLRALGVLGAGPEAAEIPSQSSDDSSMNSEARATKTR